MTENNNNTGPEIEYQFLVRKTKDGQLTMSPIDDETKPNTLDDVRSALLILIRNIDAEHQASVLHQYMMRAASAMKADAEGRTESGLVVPK